MTDIVANMEALARKWHEGAYRRGSEHLPYIVHPEAVVKLLKEWGYNETDDAVTLAVGWGHDLIEDTKVTEAEIVAAGGEAVLAGIKTLTFRYPEGIPNAEYDRLKAEYVAGVANAPAEILVVKMADRICNTLDFLRADDVPHARKYLAKGDVLFAHIGEMKHGDRIQRELDAVK